MIKIWWFDKKKIIAFVKNIITQLLLFKCLLASFNQDFVDIDDDLDATLAQLEDNDDDDLVADLISMSETPFNSTVHGPSKKQVKKAPEKPKGLTW